MKNWIKEKYPRMYSIAKSVLKPDSFSYRADIFMHLKIVLCYILDTIHLASFSKRIRDIRKIKNRHEGERCFIVGTGPSLLLSDFEALKNEYTFSMNTIYLAFPYTDWRPTYYTFIDVYGYRELVRRLNINCGEIPKKEAFLHYRIRPEKTTGKERYCLIHYGNHTKRRMKDKEIKKCYDPSLCVYDAFTVTNMAIDLAIYMGFSEIYLIGVDCNYKNNKMHLVESFMDEERKNKNYTMDREVELMLVGYEGTKKYAEAKGVKVYNATRGGNLEVFERVNFEDVIQKESSDL